MPSAQKINKVGTLLERLLFMAAAISDPWNYILILFFIGCAGAIFVTNQFWSSLMFAPNIVGTANATAAGWGNLGGGVTQIFLIAVLFNPFVSTGMSNDTAWRVAMIVPSILFVVCAVCMKLLCQDTPTKMRFDVADTCNSALARDVIRTAKNNVFRPRMPSAQQNTNVFWPVMPSAQQTISCFCPGCHPHSKK